MSARESGYGDYQSHQEMIEIKALLKLLVESQCSQLNTQNQILDSLQSIGNAALMLSPTTVVAPEEDAGNSSNATAKVADNVKMTPSVVFEEITQALSDVDPKEQYLPPFEKQLSDFTGYHKTMERNLRSQGHKVMSKKYVLDGYKQLYDAACDGDWEKASKFFKNNPQAIREVITEELETPLHIAISKNHLVFIEEIVRLMPPEVLEFKKKNSEFTALHLAIKYGNLKAAEMMVKMNQKLTQIRNCDGRVPLAYALAYTTGAQKEIVEYLYSVTNDDDPSPFLGHDGASLLCDAINQEFYDIASSLVRRFPGLVSTKSKRSKQYGFDILVGKPFTFLSGAKLTWWQRCIYSYGYDSQVNDKNPWGIDVGNEREKGKCSESTISDEENPSQSIRANIEDAENTSKISEGIIGDEYHLSVGYKVPLSTSKDPSIIKSVPIIFMPYLMRVPQIKQLYNQKLMHKQALALVKSMIGQLKEAMNRKEIAEFFNSSTAIKVAIKHGSTEFIEATLEKLYYLIWQEIGGLTMIQMAVQERDDTIFNYLCETADIMGEKLSLYSKEDKSYNTLLHYAAKLAPLAKLNLVSGAALQMQRELQWFKGVESILLKKKKFSPNIDGDTAQSIFTEEHKDLVVKGEKWMKDTSGSCMVVATLIATVAFAAAFTIPGGNISDSNSGKNGTPVFLGTTSFIVFVVADALALFSSITSVLMFLALYTSRYAEEEFLMSLPRKLVIGLGTLFISMATILVAFSAALSIALEDRCVWAPIPMALFSCVPVLLFVLLQLPLFVEIVRSAYWGSLFSKHRYALPRVAQYNGTKKDN
ncbi:uncharacterized protein LOC113341725 isoform X2 [Papaver somniferum]|uniref:uncharacterized protein LOC113341725 isoform X2 n=1 Tax=Papaver somniferum TaxID=3469 RepID=UPI000E6F9AF1|nr:uncharacterized protein LOC113341725 isoform X2 [Papaver somniferum]